ncbi:hypothetical protein ACEUAP_04880 [Aeromonas veronii]
MASAGFLARPMMACHRHEVALLDDIVSVLDDVALMTKVVVNKRETFFGKTFLTDIRDL